MKLANKAFILTLTMLALVFSMSAQTLRPIDDPRNQAPTVGTGGPPGGPTGLFTIYDGSTLRRGEFTFSAAYSDFRRDPGNADIVEVPVSFQVGVNDHIELFFNTDAYRAVKINSPRNLSSFYLPNSQLSNGNSLVRPGAIVLSTATTGNTVGLPIFRTQNAGFVQFPFIGGGINNSVGLGIIGAPTGGNGNTAARFPGLGSIYGSILPGIVLQTSTINNAGATVTTPTSFTLAPSYLPDAPFINRTYGESAFNTFTVGGKIRFTGPNNPYGIGLIPFYRFYADRARDFSGFNQLQRGASPGGNRGDVGLVLFGDARLRKWVNVSGNIGYIYNSSVKADLPSGRFTILDRPDELLAGVGVDFPVNKFFQPILEFRSTQYVGGRTPNAFENSPVEGLAGARVYPTRWMSIGGAYRHQFNQQDANSFKNTTNSTSIGSINGTVTTNTFTGVPPGFITSNDPHGFLFQVTAGRRNARKPNTVPNQFANVTSLTLSQTTVAAPCPAGSRPAEGANCSTDMTTNVTTTAVDPENDVLTYNYTVSGGRIVGQGANVQWDLTGVQPGTYTITAGVDDGCGVCGKTQTQTITVASCNCIPNCVCPTLTVTGPSGTVTGGQDVTFTANLSGGSSQDYTYNWTVTQGEITSGQGTPAITVRTTPAMAGQNITATVNVHSATCNCDKSESETFGIPAVPTGTQVNEFGAATPDEIKAQLDPFFIQLNNDPTATGYIINYGTDKDVAKREKQIRAAIAFRKYDINRVTFVRGADQGTGVRTVFWLVPAGATPPTP